MTTELSDSHRVSPCVSLGVPAISKHLAHIFEEGELDKNVAVSKMGITTQYSQSVRHLVSIRKEN